MMVTRVVNIITGKLVTSWQHVRDKLRICRQQVSDVTGKVGLVEFDLISKGEKHTAYTPHGV